MALAHLIIVEVVGRGDLHCAGALFRVGIVVGDNRDWSIDDRQPHCAPDQVLVTRVLGIHRHGRIAQHSFGPRGRHHDLA